MRALGTLHLGFLSGEASTLTVTERGVTTFRFRAVLNSLLFAQPAVFTAKLVLNHFCFPKALMM